MTLATRKALGSSSCTEYKAVIPFLEPTSRCEPHQSSECTGISTTCSCKTYIQSISFQVDLSIEHRGAYLETRRVYRVIVCGCDAIYKKVYRIGVFIPVSSLRRTYGQNTIALREYRIMNISKTGKETFHTSDAAIDVM